MTTYHNYTRDFMVWFKTLSERATEGGLKSS